MGTKSFYQGQTAEKTVAEHRARGYPIEYHECALNDQEMAGLYAACDCLAHPYRGEGFALPVVEAMACGLPAIVTGAGRRWTTPPRRPPSWCRRVGPSSARIGLGTSRPSAGPGCGSRTSMRSSSCSERRLQPVGNPRQGSRRLGLDPRSLHLVPFGGRDRCPVTVR